MNKYLTIGLLSLFCLSLPIVAYSTIELEAKTLTVETPVGTIKQEIPEVTKPIILENKIPQDLSWSITPTPTKVLPKPKPTYVHKSKRTKSIPPAVSNKNNNWIDIRLPEIKLPQVKVF